jgi:predicted dehydrogenase
MNIGFIGSGYMGYEHAKVFEFLGCNIAAVASRNPSASAERFLTQFKNARRYTDNFALLEDTEIDAVVIATPPGITETLLDRVVERNIFSLVEKPGALNINALEKIIQNQRIFFGYNRRFYESVTALKTKVEKVDGYFMFNLIEPLFENLIERKESLLNNSVHMFDLIQFLIPNSQLSYLGGDSLRYLYDICDHNKKSKGILKISFGAFRNQSIHWDGTNSSITLEPIEEFRFSNSFLIIEPSDLHPVRRYKPTTTNASDNNFIASDYAFKPGLVNQAREFLAQCNSKDKDSVNSLSKPQHAYWTLTNAKSVQEDLF